MQVYQKLLHNLLEVNRLWRLGHREDYGAIVECVRRTDEGFRQLAVLINGNAAFAKMHDLQHIPVDMYACGSSIISCTGTMESMHRVLKKLWKRTSRRPGAAQVELLNNVLLLELNDWKVSGCVSAPNRSICLGSLLCCGRAATGPGRRAERGRCV